MSGAILGGETGLRGFARGLVGGIVRELILTAESDQLDHAILLADGRFAFRQAFSREIVPTAFRGNAAFADELADRVFRRLEVSWRERYPTISPGQFLDKVEIKSPVTEQEIEDAWELEIGSSEESMRKHYEGSARTRKGADIFRYSKGGNNG